MNQIPDYPKFDRENHWYSIATAFGDGWCAEYPIAEAIRRDIENVIQDCETDKQKQEIRQADMADWVDSLYVYDNDDNEIAEFIISTGQWRTRRKPGGGRKPKHGEPMVQLQARVPPAIRAQLIAEFGSVQKAVDALIIAPRMAREQKNNGL